MGTSPLLRVEALRTVVQSAGADQVVVDCVDLDVEAGETVALVGESGSGKSMTALSIARLLARNVRTASGRVLLDGQDLLALSPNALKSMRGRGFAMVFQEPMTSLNPVLTIGTQLTEAVRLRPEAGMSRRQQAVTLLDSVGIAEPQRRVDQYPHQLSGGMRQRVMVAIAIAAHPRLLIADEPTTALDVTTQAQILDLIRLRVTENRTALLLITHDMGLVARYAQRVNVMYAGTIVERASASALFSRPSHPYTRGLLASVPRLDRERQRRLPAIEGLPPSLTDRPSGCSFRPRCTFSIDRCAEKPLLSEVAPGHMAACWRATEVAAMSAEPRVKTPDFVADGV
ncbi:MAG: ABC transporter ATP-binding protein [Lautropia sp.]